MFALEKRFLRHTHKIFHRIIIKEGAKPIKIRPHNLNNQDKQELEKQIQELVQIGIIERTSNSQWSSPVLLVDKVDSNSKRLVIDARKLNEVTMTETFYNPTVTEIITSLHGAKVFSKFDLTSGYWQVPIHPDDTHMTSFATHIGNFQYRYAAFGLKNSSVTLGKLLTELLAPMIGKSLFIYQDDLLCFSENETKHREIILNLFDILDSANLSINAKKSRMFKKKITFLGYSLDEHGIEIKKESIEAIVNLDYPRCKREVRGFLGSIQYFAKHIKSFHTISAPLRKLTSNKNDFCFEREQRESFNKLKQLLLESQF